MDERLLSDVRRFSEKLSREDNILVVGHHDADGITACAIAVDFLRRLGKTVDFTVIKQLDSLMINKINSIKHDVLLFVDMGSGQLNLLQENENKGEIGKYYILDHHPPEKEYPLQVNPHFFGFDGGFEISGAGMSYLAAKSLGFNGMAHIAVVGAVGDMQDSRGRLQSLNREILEDAAKQGLIKVKNDLRLFGRQSRLLSQMLAYASEPVIPSLTGNPHACTEFIHKQGIKLKNPDESWRHYVDLSWEERRKLTTALYCYMLDLNTPEFVVQDMVGEVYTLLHEKKKTELRDAKEFSTLLNACGRQNKPEVGVKVCLGDRGEALHDAMKLLEKHRRLLREGVEYLSQTGVEKKDSLYFFDSQDRIDENIIGVVAGMAYGARIIPPDKPVIAFAFDKDDPNMLKISSRANWDLVRKGIHLGNAMRDGARSFGGEGGGHDIAAGARIPKEYKWDFLDKVDLIFKSQLK